MGLITKNGQQKPEAEAIKAQVGPLVPFVRAAHEHREIMSDETITLTTSTQARGPFDVPAYGYLRHILLLVEASGGTLGSGVLHEDYPFNIIESVLLSDVNGAPIVTLTGFDLYLANLIGNYVWQQDPADAPNYVATINAAFMVRIPVEITSWDGYGALPNQNAANTYKLRITVNASTTIYTTAVTTNPSVRVRTYTETWSQPTPQNLNGEPQEQTPPALGTTQFWSYHVKSPAAGANTFILPRVGNMIRNLIIVGRTTAPARSATVLPDPISLKWDGRDLDTTIPQTIMQKMFFERCGQALPTGVLAYDFTHDQDGKLGNENRHLYLPTVEATRLEISGTWAAAGTLYIITNDVAPV